MFIKKLLYQCSGLLIASAVSTALHAQTVITPIRVAYSTIPILRTVDGVVEAVNQATLSAQTSGQVLEVNFDVDDFVKKGTVLMRFEKKEQEATLAQSKAKLSEARAYLKAAQDSYKRTKAIYAKRAVSKSQYDKTVAELNAARARLRSAQANIDKVDKQVDYTVIRAPYSGVVLKRHIEPGEIAKTGQPIMTGFSLDKLRSVASVTQEDIVAIRKNRLAEIVLQTPVGIKKFTGEDLIILPHADMHTHTFRVRVHFPEKTKDIYPGMFNKINFKIGDKRALLVPISSIAYRGEVRAVYAVNANSKKLRMRQVRLGQVYQDRVEILAGVSEGDLIASDPVVAAIALKEQREAP